MNELSFTATVFNLDPKQIKSVPVSLMPGDFYREATGVVEPRQCYDNCRILMMMNAIKDYRYVLVYSFGLIPFEHAIIKLDDGTYVDPTLEIVNPEHQVKYIVTHELDYDELCDVAIRIGRAPNISDMLNVERYGDLSNEKCIQQDIVANSILASELLEVSR